MKKRILVLLTVVAQMMVMLAMSLTPAVARPLHKNATRAFFISSALVAACIRNARSSHVRLQC